MCSSSRTSYYYTEFWKTNNKTQSIAPPLVKPSKRVIRDSLMAHGGAFVGLNIFNGHRTAPSTGDTVSEGYIRWDTHVGHLFQFDLCIASTFGQHQHPVPKRRPDQASSQHLFSAPGRFYDTGWSAHLPPPILPFYMIALSHPL
jgi:hypothetical protein